MDVGPTKLYTDHPPQLQFECESKRTGHHGLSTLSQGQGLASAKTQMAGTRIHRLGTIFSRANGLLRSGALQDEDKPLWYDVYEAFPPQLEPKYERSVSQKEVVNILYPEDLIRAKFYKIYGNPDVVDLTNKGVDTTCQKFVKKYFQQQKLGVPRDQLFDTVVNLLKQEGIRLRTLEDVQQDKLKINARSHLPGAKEVFGDKITKQREEDDFIEEER